MRKAGELDDIYETGGDVDLFDAVNIGEDGNRIFFADFGKNLEPFGESGAAVGVDRGAVGFVVGCFEDERNGEAFCHAHKAGGNIECLLAIFNYTGACDEGEWMTTAEADAVNSKIFTHGMLCS